jgi:hypothetical protein
MWQVKKAVYEKSMLAMRQSETDEYMFSTSSLTYQAIGFDVGR